jgi:P27 family predicted phage terminase small subunit
MPSRIPESTKKRRGTSRKDRLPPAPRGSRWKVPPKPPKDSGLDPGVWSELAAAVNNRGCATSSDKPAFGELVRAMSLARKAAAEVDEAGFTYVATSGARKASPAVAVWTAATKTTGALLAHFGLTPASRERVAEAPTSGEQAERD